MKKRRRYVAQRRVPTRRWHIPPPLIHGSDTLEGGSILQEWNSELGVVLWQAFRDVMLWATSEPECRGAAFTPGSALRIEEVADAKDDPRLIGGLEVIHQLVADAGGADEEIVGQACRAVSEWAQEQGKLNTALAFAQNAALVDSADSAAAFWVATLAGRLNDHARAEGWFRRAVGLARQGRDWRMYSQSFSGLGNLYIRRGNLPAARRLHTRALRGARRGGMRREQAFALHDLFVVAVELGNVGEAERLARQALEACGTKNERVHALAHDVAYFWMEHGNFGRALAVFRAILPLIERPIERTFVLANIVRAAGGVADRHTAGEAAAEVHQLLLSPALAGATARALLEVGRGFLSLGEYDMAEEVASRALASATENRENKVRFAVESLLSSINERAIFVATDAGAERPGAGPDTGDELAADFVRTLETIAGAA
jgi:tetratricopeptide (TPR) repeat protein